MNLEHRDLPEPLGPRPEKKSLPEKICTIEVVDYMPGRTNPTISVAHTDAEFQVSCILVSDETATVAYMARPTYELFDQKRNRVSMQPRLDPYDAFRVATSLCLSWMGFNFNTSDLSTHESFFASADIRALLFDEDGNMPDEEEALRRMTALERIAAVSVSFPAEFLLHR